MNQLKRGQVVGLVDQADEAAGGQQFDHVAGRCGFGADAGHGAGKGALLLPILWLSLCLVELSPNLFRFLCGSMTEGKALLPLGHGKQTTT
jgi:hypothetical protein